MLFFLHIVLYHSTCIILLHNGYEHRNTSAKSPSTLQLNLEHANTICPSSSCFASGVSSKMSSPLCITESVTVTSSTSSSTASSSCTSRFGFTSSIGSSVPTIKGKVRGDCVFMVDATIVQDLHVKFVILFYHSYSIFAKRQILRIFRFFETFPTKITKYN